MISILIVDDHEILRQGLRLLLNQQSDMRVVGEAKDGREALAMIADLRPTVVVMDLSMPMLNGIDTTRQALAANHSTKIICLTATVSHKLAAEALAAGAEGFVLKESAFEELVTAIRNVVQQKVYISPAVAGFVVDDLRRRGDGTAHRSGKYLSSREREILQMISEGFSTKQIAYGLHISVKTVETHRRNLMEKIGIDNIAGLVKHAIREGLSAV